MNIIELTALVLFFQPISCVSYLVWLESGNATAFICFTVLFVLVLGLRELLQNFASRFQQYADILRASAVGCYFAISILGAYIEPIALTGGAVIAVALVGVGLVGQLIIKLNGRAKPLR